MQFDSLAQRWLPRAALALTLAFFGSAAQAQPLTTLGSHNVHAGVRCAPAFIGASYGTSRPYRRGSYQTRCEQVWVPAQQERVWVAPRYEWRLDPCGRQVRVLVCAGHYTQRLIPGRYESRSVRVWVPARRVEFRPTRHRVTHVGHRYRR